MLSGGFVPITEAFPLSKEEFNCSPRYVLDCHHRRVLLCPRLADNFLVWDPITGEREEVLAPAHIYGESAVVLMPTEDGLLGLACTRASTLYLWSEMVNGEAVAGWVQCRVIKLLKVLGGSYWFC
jgi:hypothetical protein